MKNLSHKHRAIHSFYYEWTNKWLYNSYTSCGNFGLWLLDENLVFAFPFKSAYLGASRTSRSATFPFSMEPCVFERPMLWAELIVEATRASARLIFKLTAAKCMTAGWKVFTRHVNIRTHYEFGASPSYLKFKRFDLVTKFLRNPDQDQDQTGTDYGPDLRSVWSLIQWIHLTWIGLLNLYFQVDGGQVHEGRLKSFHKTCM